MDAWDKVERRQRVYAAIFRRARRREAYSVIAMVAGVWAVLFAPIMAYVFANLTGWFDPTLAAATVLGAIVGVTLVGMIVAAFRYALLFCGSLGRARPA